MRRAYKTYALLPFSVIEAATSGNVDALNQVLKHYEAYIATLTTRHLYDESGVLYYSVDEELRKILEIKLIAKILRFKLDKSA